MDTETQKRKKGVMETYAQAAQTYDHVGPAFFTHFAGRLVEVMELNRDIKVLDIATGRGAVLFAAAEKVGSNGQVVGLDLSPEMVNLTAQEIQERTVQNASVIQMDAEHLAFPSQYFDAVTCGSALFLFPDLERALDEFFRVLKPGGMMGTTTWGKFDERWTWLDDMKRDAFTPENPFPKSWQLTLSTETLAQMLEEANFSQVQSVEEEREFEVLDEETWWAWQMSNGWRYLWDSMDVAKREECKMAAMTKIRELRSTQTLYQRFNGILTVAHKS